MRLNDEKKRYELIQETISRKKEEKQRQKFFQTTGPALQSSQQKLPNIGSQNQSSASSSKRQSSARRFSKVSQSSESSDILAMDTKKAMQQYDTLVKKMKEIDMEYNYTAAPHLYKGKVPPKVQYNSAQKQDLAENQYNESISSSLSSSQKM
eukprot:TRINITY_DN5510_c0_g1_i1.p3 TRINITY_DN5510_c0_g1~~TRINITY_DN5510_c0_g1_i1.p3  ORF type:complete len:152 (-),score=16.24 TRINITY_DN5510_c0_g1_i1:112-567(-)